MPSISAMYAVYMPHTHMALMDDTDTLHVTATMLQYVMDMLQYVSDMLQYVSDMIIYVTYTLPHFVR